MSITQKLFTTSAFFLFFNVLAAQTPTSGWTEDLKTVRDDLPNFHPRFFRKITQKSWDEQFATLLNRLDGKSDLQIALELQRVIAQSGDPGTYLDVSPLLYKSRFIPVALGFYEGQFYVSASVRRFAPIFGTKVLKINGLATRDAVNLAAQFVAKDNEIGYLTNAMQMLRFPVANQMAGVSQTDTLELLCEKPSGEQFKFKVWPLSPMDDKQGMIPIVPQRDAPELLFRPLNKPFDLEWHARDSILIFRYVRCLSREMLLENGDTATAVQLPSFKFYADSAIAVLRRCPTARLLLDLRFNPGGGGASDGFKFANWLTLDSTLTQRGRVFVAINSATLSSATHVALLFRNLTKAVLVGEPTGDRPNHFGQPKIIYLPNTQLTVNYSSKYLQPVQTEEVPTLVPEVLIPMSFQTFLRGGDPVLDWLRERGFEKMKKG